MALTITVDGFDDGSPIPAEFAFCQPADEGHVTAGGNRNPRVSWSGIPEGTRSLALVCVDPDAPTVPDDVNKDDRTVPMDLPRGDFYHWVLVDIPPTRSEIAEGADSEGQTPRGKEPGATEYGVNGINDYTNWFAGDDDLEGEYGGYDGPCPPWNDELVHRYVFRLYALDTESLGLSGPFAGADVEKAMDGHVLERAEYTGTYTQNPDLL